MRDCSRVACTPTACLQCSMHAQTHKCTHNTHTHQADPSAPNTYTYTYTHKYINTSTPNHPHTHPSTAQPPTRPHTTHTLEHTHHARMNTRFPQHMHPQNHSKHTCRTMLSVKIPLRRIHASACGTSSANAITRGHAEAGQQLLDMGIMPHTQHFRSCTLARHWERTSERPTSVRRGALTLIEE